MDSGSTLCPPGGRGQGIERDNAVVATPTGQIGRQAVAQNKGFYDGEHDPRTATSFGQWCADVLMPAVSSA